MVYDNQIKRINYKSLISSSKVFFIKIQIQLFFSIEIDLNQLFLSFEQWNFKKKSLMFFQNL